MMMAGSNFAFKQQQRSVRSSSYNRFLHPIPEASEELDFGLQHFRPASPESDLDVPEVISNADESELDLHEISEQFPRPATSVFSSLSDFQFPRTSQTSWRIPFDFEFAPDEKVAPDKHPVAEKWRSKEEALPVELCGTALQESHKHNRLDTCSPQPGETTYDSLLDLQLSELRHSCDEVLAGTVVSQSRPDSPTCGVAPVFQISCAEDNSRRKSTTCEQNDRAPLAIRRTSSVFSQDSVTLCATLGSLRIPLPDFDDLDWQSGKSPTRTTFQVFPAQEEIFDYAKKEAQHLATPSIGYVHDGSRQTWPLKIRSEYPDDERTSWRESGCTLHSFYEEYFKDSTSTHRMSTDTMQALEGELKIAVAAEEDAAGGTPSDLRITSEKLSNIQTMDEKPPPDRPEVKSCLVVAPPTPPPPDGGPIAWVQVAAASILFFNTWGLINAFGAFQSYYHTTLLANQASNAAIAWIGTLTSFLLCASPLAWGPVFDRVESDSMLRAVVTTATAVVVTGVVATSICTEYWQLVLAQGLCCGTGGGMLFLTAVAVLPGWFTRRRPFAIGLAGAGGSIGGIIYPLIFEGLQIRFGFGWSVRVIGLVVLATQTVPCTIIRRRPRPAHLHHQADVESRGAPIAVDPLKISTSAANFHQTCDEVSASLKALLSDRPFTIFNFATFFGFAGQYIPFFFLDQYANFSTPVANDAAIDATSPTIVLSSIPIIPPMLTMLLFLNLGSLPGRIIPSLLASLYPEYLPPLHLLTLTTATSASLAFLWPALPPDNLSLLVVWSLCYGFCSGGFVSLQGAAVAQMAAITPKNGSAANQVGAPCSQQQRQQPTPGLGARFGVNMCAGGFGTLIGAPAAGALLALPSGGWLTVQMYCGTVLALSAIAVVAAGSYVGRCRDAQSTDRSSPYAGEAPRHQGERSVTAKISRPAKTAQLTGAQPLRGTRSVTHKREELSVWWRGLRNHREEAEKKRKVGSKETQAEQDAREARQREHDISEFLQGPS